MSGKIPIRAEMVACFVINLSGKSPQMLLLRRLLTDSHAPGTWQMIYGHLEDNETPEQTVSREITEETGLMVEQLYTLDESFTFYDTLHKAMQLTPIFVALVDCKGELKLDLEEHIAGEWVDFAQARLRLPWPSQKRALDTLNDILKTGGLPDIMHIDVA